MGIQHVTASFSRPASATQYTAGDAISNSGTGSASLPITFTMPSARGGIITGCRCVVTPASGNLVITALDFDLLLFRPATDIPFAAGSYPADNGAMAISAAAYREFVGHFSFVNTLWRNTLGALTAGVTGYQAVAPLIRTRGYPFSVPETTPYLIGVVQAIGVWNPTGVVNQFDFTLDIES